jgi:transcriptional repressor NrdR
MVCPSCNASTDKVIDSRPSEGGRVIRRRRQCLSCGKRFTTYERVEPGTRLVVVKRSGEREPFSPQKLLAAVLAAASKKSLSDEDARRLVEQVEEEVQRDFDRDVPSAEIGARVMSRLRELDEVAYIRFACAHRRFRSAEDVREELAHLAARPRHDRGQQGLFDAAPVESPSIGDARGDAP